MRQGTGVAVEAAAPAAGSVYMPSYNSTTAGRLRRIRRERGVSPSKSKLPTASAIDRDSPDSQEEASAVRLRRCPMRHQEDFSNVQASLQTKHAGGSTQNQGAPLDQPSLKIKMPDDPSAAGKTSSSSSGCSGELRNSNLWFIRPPNGSNVPPRLRGYEKYVQDCIRRHRESSDAGGRDRARALRLVHTEASIASPRVCNGMRSSSYVDVTGTENSQCEKFSAQSAQSTNSFSDLVRPNEVVSSLSNSTSALFVASSDEFEDSLNSRRTEEAVFSAWDELRKPAQLPRPPRFEPGVSIDDMRRAVSQSSRAKKNVTAHPSSSIDSEYQTNLKVLHQKTVDAPSSSWSSSSSMLAHSLSLNAMLSENQLAKSLGRSGRAWQQRSQNHH